jgi:hypothetical protein
MSKLLAKGYGSGYAQHKNVRVKGAQHAQLSAQEKVARYGKARLHAQVRVGHGLGKQDLSNGNADKSRAA